MQNDTNFPLKNFLYYDKSTSYQIKSFEFELYPIPRYLYILKNLFVLLINKRN